MNNWERAALFFMLFTGLSTALFAQNNQVLFQEDFEGSVSAWQLNAGGPVSTSGNNQWVINNAYAGDIFYPVTPPQTATLGAPITFANGHYLHVHNLGAAPGVSNANFHPALASDAFVAMANGICTRSLSNVRFTFHCLNGAATSAQAQVYFQVNGGAWQAVGPVNPNPTLVWDTVSITHPSFDNVDDLRFGFRWINLPAAPPANPSFGVDDLSIRGDYNPSLFPVTLSLSGLPTTVCQGDNLLFSYQQTGNVCDGDYTLNLLNGSTVVNQWPLSLSGGTTSGYLQVNLLSSVATGSCYNLRLDRTGPGSQATGQASACFSVTACANTVSVLAPSLLSLEGSIAAGSVCNVPFWSTGSFLPGNVYSVELSDGNGSFVNPLVVGNWTSFDSFDPLAVVQPGMVSADIPIVPDGCNYRLRMRSSQPNLVGSEWGPFCVKNMPLETNNQQNAQMCLSANSGDTLLVSLQVNNSSSYLSSNYFALEVVNPENGQVLSTNSLGGYSGNTSGSVQWAVADLNNLLFQGLTPGAYFLRFSASHPVNTENAFSPLIRLNIGAPSTIPLSIQPTDSLACQGAADQIVFSVANSQAQANYQWFLQGQAFPPNTPQHPLTVEFNGTSGAYSFQVQEEHFGCFGPLSLPEMVEVLDPPTGNVTGPIQGCVGDTLWFESDLQNSTNYQWSLGASSTGQLIQGAHAAQVGVQWLPPANGAVSLQLIQASNRCGQASGTQSLALWDQPIASAGTGSSLCYGDSLHLQGIPTGSGGQAPYQYRWFPNGGQQVEGHFLPQTSGVYGVEVTDANGCRQQDLVNITVLPAPFVNAGRDTSICRGESLTLGGNPTAASTDFLSWGPVAEIQSPGLFNPVVQPLMSSRYVVTVTDAQSGCSWSDAISVKVATGGPPVVIPTPLCPDGKAELQPAEGKDYFWSDRSSSATLQVVKPGTYSVWVAPEQGCPREYIFPVEAVLLEDSVVAMTLCLDEPWEIPAGERQMIWEDGSTASYFPVSGDGNYFAEAVEPHSQCPYNLSFEVEMNDCRKSLYLPEAFTPNGDGLNDLFEPVLDGEVEVLEWTIFDRWGKVVFQAGGWGSWNGNWRGKALPDGNYAWHIRYKVGGLTKQESGTVVLLRPDQVSGGSSF